MKTISSVEARALHNESGRNPFSFKMFDDNTGRYTVLGAWGNIHYHEDVKIPYENGRTLLAETVEFV